MLGAHFAVPDQLAADHAEVGLDQVGVGNRLALVPDRAARTVSASSGRSKTRDPIARSCERMSAAARSTASPAIVVERLAPVERS